MFIVWHKNKIVYISNSFQKVIDFKWKCKYLIEFVNITYEPFDKVK